MRGAAMQREGDESEERREERREKEKKRKERERCDNSGLCLCPWERKRVCVPAVDADAQIERDRWPDCLVQSAHFFSFDFLIFCGFGALPSSLSLSLHQPIQHAKTCTALPRDRGLAPLFRESHAGAPSQSMTSASVRQAATDYHRLRTGTHTETPGPDIGSSYPD